MSGEHEIKLLCETVVASRSGYYAWLRAGESARAQQDRALQAQIQVVHSDSRGPPATTRPRLDDN